MTTDKELQRLAAKAAGINHPGGEHSIFDDGRVWDCDSLRWWNPLHDDGDALRLAVKLNIFNTRATGYEWPAIELFESHGDDAYSSTRNAIVRAAAALAS